MRGGEPPRTTPSSWSILGARSLSVLLLAAVIGAWAGAAPAWAGDFDGSKKLLCVPVQGYHCAPGAECARVTAEDVNIPQFIRVDVKRKSMSGVGEKESTSIQNVRKADGKTILQGAENGRGWSMVIDQVTGKMSASISDNRVGFLMFGACTPL